MNIYNNDDITNDINLAKIIVEHFEFNLDNSIVIAAIDGKQLISFMMFSKIDDKYYLTKQKLAGVQVDILHKMMVELHRYMFVNDIRNVHVVISDTTLNKKYSLYTAMKFTDLTHVDMNMVRDSRFNVFEDDWILTFNTDLGDLEW